jgi:cytidine deaminase
VRAARARKELTPGEVKRLVAAAARARKNASAPYSKFHVGAALLTNRGKIYGGCNVESASYGLTVCAERNAVFSAIADGKRGFRAIAVITDVDPPTPPCGACRQVLWDQCRDIEVILAATSGRFERTTMSALLPRAFEFGGPE